MTTATAKDRILKTAVGLARKRGFHKFTRDEVAHDAGVGVGTVNYHFGTITELRNAVMTHAVQNKLLEILAEGLVTGHPLATAAPLSLRRQAAAGILR